MKRLFISGILFLLVFISADTQAQNGSWTQKASIPDTGRFWAAGFTVGNEAYVGLGADTKNFWKFDPLNNIWTQMATFPGASFFYTTAFELSNSGYVYVTDLNMAQFWQFNTLNNAWIQKTSFPGSNRVNAVSFSGNGKGYLGLGDDGNSFYQDIWDYDQFNDSWTLASSFPYTSRTQVGCSVIGNTAYFSCGNGAHQSFNDVYGWNFPTNIWFQATNLPSTPRNSPVSFALNGKLYVGLGDTNKYGQPGGGANEFLNDFWEWTPGNNSWLPQCQWIFPHRFRSTSLSISNKGYLFFGCRASSGAWPIYADVYEFDPNGITTAVLNSSETSIYVYPNPIKDKLSVKIPDNKGKTIEIKIYSLAGQLVFSKQESPDEDFIRINDLQVPDGVYLLKVNFGGNTAIKKIVVAGS